MNRFFSVVRHVVKYGCFLLLIVVFLSHSMVRNAAADRIYSDYRELSDHDAVLLLGTSRFSRSGRPNPFFERRVRAAATLIESGRADVVVASGDNSHTNYNEPAQMTDALTERGVPAERIVQDYAGFRTLDSVVRMHEVFGQDNFIIVSQRFHVERALFLADAFGINAVGFAAEDVTGRAYLSVRLREYAARVQAVLDVYVFGTGPRFLGEPVPIELP